MPQDQRNQHLRLVLAGEAAPATVARIDLDRPGAMQELHDVAGDWLYAGCSDVGRRKLLQEHDLLAA